MLGSAAGEASLQLVSFVNQPAGRGASVPDARISAHFAYWFETKTARDALRADQIDEHLKCLNPAATGERLFIVTPDPVKPSLLDRLNDPRVVWFNFRSLHDAVDAVLSDASAFVSEHARFLLREFQALLVDDGLVDNDDVVVVAAGGAYREYLEHGVYICQPNRAFRRGLTHLGFYADGAIQREVPAILLHADSVPFTAKEAEERSARGGVDARVADAIVAFLSSGRRTEGNDYGVFVLSNRDDPGTVVLESVVVNDTVAASGRPWAWTMGQRYTSLARLSRPGVTKTSDLLA
ncbi:MAG: hypothetical protein IT200_11235 [Thermoleophilia bacterium]|nr:hypothetical protein [Thermoleophilia bacterium]